MGTQIKFNGGKMKKEKISDYNKVFGTMIIFNDGTICRDNFDSVQLGNILGTWRGTIHSLSKNLKRVYEQDHSIYIVDIKNTEGEKIIIPIQKISYIKYIQNTGCMGSKKDPKVYDWDKDFD